MSPGKKLRTADMVHDMADACSELGAQLLSLIKIKPDARYKTNYTERS